jgi:hypothetical protein
MHVLDVLYKIWPIACGALIIGAVWWRTRSFFFIVHQILKWLGLEGKYTNAEDQKVADDYLDLNKFNLKTGFRLRSVKAKSKLHGWMRANDFEFAELRLAGWYFKANELRFDIPSAWRTWFVRVSFVALGTFCIGAGQFVKMTDYALLKINATDTWFWVGNNEAYSLRFNLVEILRGDAWRLQQGDCRYTADPIPPLDVWDRDVICHLVLGFNDGYIAEAIDSQVKTAFGLTLFGGGCFGLFLLFALWLQRAKGLHAKVGIDASVSDSGRRSDEELEPTLASASADHVPTELFET